MRALRIVYFVTVFLFLYNDVTAHIDFSKDDQSIEIYPGNSDNPYLMLENNYSHLIFKNFTGISIECTYGDQENYETHRQFNYTIGRLNMIILSKFMSTRWECTGYDYNDSPTTKYIFIIKVKAAKKVNVTISGENVEFKITNLSVKEYDGVYEYACAEGDTIDLICKSPHKEGQIKLKYYDANGSNIFETNSSADKYLTFQKLVRDKNDNGSYIECSYITPIITVEQTYTYRIIFTVTTATLKSSGLIVTINDTKLKLSALSEHIYTYEYKFVDWVPLKLTCEVKHQNLYINENMINYKNIVLRDIKKTPSKYSAVIETNNLDGAIFDCYSESKVKVSISFSKDLYRDPFIQGLLASNILYQYNIDNLHWIIHYQYEIFDVLNLTCFTEYDRQPKWKYDRENITSTILKREKNSRYIMNQFHMNDKSNKNISCESNKTTTNTRTITIILHPISGLGNSDFEYNPIGDDTHTSTQSIPLKDVPLIPSSEGLHLTVPKIIGIVAGVVITAVTVICVFYWWRSRRIILTKEEAPYRSFNQEDYHEYTYIQSEYDKMKNEDSNMKINDLYIGGGLDNPCKTMTAPTENHYTEIDGMSITYAVPYEVHNTNKTETSGNQKLYNNLHRESENKKSNVSYGNLKKDCSNLSYANMGQLHK